MLWIGALAGGMVGFLIGQAKVKDAMEAFPVPENWLLPTLVILGILGGASTGFSVKPFNETRYEWRYHDWEAEK